MSDTIFESRKKHATFILEQLKHDIPCPMCKNTTKAASIRRDQKMVQAPRADLAFQDYEHIPPPNADSPHIYKHRWIRLVMQCEGCLFVFFDVTMREG